MAFKDQLKEKLSDIPKKEQELLPTGFQRIGDIIVLNLKQELESYKQEIGKITLELNPGIRTVANKTGAITGQFREPQIEILAGDNDPITTHFENNCYYKFDIQKIMFAKGNLSERVRLVKQVKKTEIIIDMFAGIGYFTIPIAKLARPKKIYSIELNPISFQFLKENLKLNKIESIVEPINGDSKIIIPELLEKGIKADRVLMGYLPPPKEFLDSAMKIIKKDAMLHYEDLIKVDIKDQEIERSLNDVREAAKKAGYQVKLIHAQRVKGYGPKIDHYVLDILVY